jgi:hypothetical protein
MLHTTLSHYYSHPILLSYFLKLYSKYDFPHISSVIQMAVFQQAPTYYCVDIRCSPILAICLTHCSLLRFIALTTTCDLCL